MTIEDDYLREDDPDEDNPKGLPAYMGTFADLMALLLCFFVLLLSFSEIDALRYEEVIKSLKNAFGVQRDYVAPQIPLGTSIVAEEFSPGEPKPTPIVVVERQTGDNNDTLMNKMDILEAAIEAHKDNIEKEAQQIKSALASEIEEGFIEVEGTQDRIVIRIKESGSFESGDDKVNDSFLPVLETISDTLSGMIGNVAVSGHTDNVPINNERFNSNWDLSSSRATKVVSIFESFGDIAPERLVVEGYADKAPIETNITAEGRASNRRVEVTLLKSLGSSAGAEIDELKDVLAGMYGDVPDEKKSDRNINPERVSEDEVSGAESSAADTDIEDATTTLIANDNNGDP